MEVSPLLTGGSPSKYSQLPGSLRWVHIKPLRGPLWHPQTPPEPPVSAHLPLPKCILALTLPAQCQGNWARNLSPCCSQACPFLLGVPSAVQQRPLLTDLKKTPTAGISMAQNFRLLWTLRRPVSTLQKAEGKLSPGLAQGAQ